MAKSNNLVILEQDHARFMGVLEQLNQEANAKLVFLVDKAGQQIASAGDMSEVDPTSLASLTAGNVAATEGVAQLLGEREFSTLYHEGRRDNLHISVVGERFILLVVFDERSSLGLVRLRVEQQMMTLGTIVTELMNRTEEQTKKAATLDGTPFSEITDDDIDALFG